MIYLFTGSPGAGKTLNLIKFILEEKSFLNRPVFAYNIRGLNVPHWQEITEEQAKDWESLPDGSLVILDEAQDLFRPRRQGDKVPDYLAGLEKHRHRGFDFFLTTQSPMLIDTHLRRLVFRHFHFERPFGLKKVRRLEWQKCVNDPDDFHTRQDATKSLYSIDKKYFGYYQSAEIHTVKAAIPARFWLLLVLVVFVVGLIVWFVRGFGSRHSQAQPVAAPVSQIAELPKSPLSPTVPDMITTDACVFWTRRRVCTCYTADRAAHSWCERVFQLGAFDDPAIAITIPQHTSDGDDTGKATARERGRRVASIVNGTAHNF